MGRMRSSSSRPGRRGKAGSIGSVARHEFVRTGRKEPGALLRAFELKYPNRSYSTKVGPKIEND